MRGASQRSSIKDEGGRVYLNYASRHREIPPGEFIETALSPVCPRRIAFSYELSSNPPRSGGEKYSSFFRAANFQISAAFHRHKPLLLKFGDSAI